MKKFEEINKVMTIMLDENGIEKNKINWAKQVKGWNSRNKNGYFFIGNFTDLYYPFQGNEIILVCFGKEKRYLIVKINEGAGRGIVIYSEKETQRNWSKIEDVLKKNLKNSVETRKEQEIVTEIWGEIGKLPIERLERLRENISKKITELKKQEFEKKLSGYTDLGYENGWPEIPEILKDNSYVVHERRKSRIEKQRWIDELKVKWEVDSSD